MHRFPLWLIASPLVVALLATACGGGSGTPGPDNGIPADVDTAPPVPGIDTVVSTTAIKAGGEVTVQCTGYGFDPQGVRLVVQVQEGVVAPPPDTSEEVPGEDAHAPSPTEPPDTTLPDGVTQTGMTLRFTKTDRYLVACYAPDEEMLDDTPARIVVSPGPAVTIETEVDPHELKAGGRINLTCTAEDTFGNTITYNLTPSIVPSAGVLVSGLSAQLTVAGTYQVACAVKDTAIVDPTPETVTVGPNLPKKIVTHLEPSEIEAGEATTVTCAALDFYDNPVKDLPLSIYMTSPLLTLAGRSISTTTAGVYPIKCVPQNEDWSYFQIIGENLVVLPGRPVSLTLKKIPNKGYYGRNETLRVTAEAVDGYGNLIPDAELVNPVTITPPTGIQPVAENPTGLFLLKEEGQYQMTFRLRTYPDIYAHLDVTVEGSGPLLSIVFPERGMTLTGKPSVTLRGFVGDDETGVSEIRVNGMNAINGIKPDGTFAYLLTPIKQGLNTVKVEVTNGAGIKTETGLGFYFSSVYYPASATDVEAGLVTQGARAFLGRDFIDDGDHSLPPDDLATLVETMLTSLDIGALLPNPVAEAGPYKVLLSNLAFGKPTTALRLFDGGINVFIQIPNFRIDVAAIGTCNFIIDWCPDVSGRVSSSGIIAVTDVLVWMDGNGRIQVQTQDVQVALQGLDVDIDGLLGDLLGWLIDLLVDTFTKAIEQAVEDQIGQLIDETLADLLNEFEIDETFEIPALLGGKPSAISLLTKPSHLAVEPEGIWLDMAGTLYATKGVSRNPLGSIGRGNCLAPGTPPTFELPWDSEVSLAAHDDLLNQALFAVWWGGTLNMKIGAEDLGDVDLSEYFIENLEVDLDFLLPPILTDCPVPEQIQAQVGDLYVEARFSIFDSPVEIGLFLQATANVNLGLVEGEEGTEVAISLDADSTPDIDIEIVSIDGPFTADVIMDMLYDPKTGILPDLLADVAGTELVSVAIPSIDLSALVADLPPGTTLSIDLQDLYRELGFTVVQGKLK